MAAEENAAPHEPTAVEVELAVWAFAAEFGDRHLAVIGPLWRPHSSQARNRPQGWTVGWVGRGQWGRSASRRAAVRTAAS